MSIKPGDLVVVVGDVSDCILGRIGTVLRPLGVRDVFHVQSGRWTREAVYEVQLPGANPKDYGAGMWTIPPRNLRRLDPPSSMKNEETRKELTA